MNSEQAKEIIRDQYNTNHLRLPPERMTERRAELRKAAEALTEKAFESLTENQRHWLVGETVGRSN